MTPHAYNELELVEAAAMEVLASLRWSTVSGVDETFGTGGTLGRDSPRDTVLISRLRAVLGKLNRDTPAAALSLAVDELIRDRGAMGAAAANREIQRLLTDGITVSVRNDATGAQESRTIRVIDWERP